MRDRRILVGRLVVGTLSLLCLANVAQAQPSAGQVLADAGLAADDQQSVLNGQFVTASVTTVSDRDLSFAIAFLVKEAPATLSKQIVAGDLITADAQVKAYGEIKGAGTLADFAKLTITSAEAQALTGAKAGEDVNLSASELAAFKALAGGTTQAVQQQLRRMLLARYQDYRASGLAGIPPYDRGGGRTSDPAGDLRKATEAARGLEKYLPAFQKLLLNYPQATLPGMQENFFWLRSLIEKKWTYILVHILSAARRFGPRGGAPRVLREHRLQCLPVLRGIPARSGGHGGGHGQPRVHRPGHGIRRLHEAQHRKQGHGESDEGNLRGGTREGPEVAPGEGRPPLRHGARRVRTRAGRKGAWP